MRTTPDKGSSLGFLSLLVDQVSIDGAQWIHESHTLPAELSSNGSVLGGQQSDTIMVFCLGGILLGLLFSWS